MNALPRFLLFLSMTALMIYLFREARIANNLPEPDSSRVVMLFCGVVGTGIVAGILFVMMILPRVGDAVGNFFFQPNVKVEKDPHSSAVAALARGDYETAIEEYRQILEANPADTLAYSEMAKISCEHLEDSLGASRTLEEALQREWAPEDAAFLSARLVDVYWKYQHDARSALALLLQIIEALPGTRHAANAEHRLREIEQQVAQEG